jgi:hypothetical protein
MEVNTSSLIDFHGFAHAASSHADYPTVQIFLAAVVAVLGAILMLPLKSYVSYHRKMSLYPSPNYESFLGHLFSSKARDKFVSNAKDLIREGFSQVSCAIPVDKTFRWAENISRTSPQFV